MQEYYSKASEAIMVVSQKTSFFIPQEIVQTLKALEQKGFLAYIVGGCVRDLLRGEEAQDWDIATNAKPEEIQQIFPDSFYENNFGTVTVKMRNEEQGPASEDELRQNTGHFIGHDKNTGQIRPNSGQISKESGQITNLAYKLVHIEVTTFRKEGRYSDKRHPDSIQFAKTIEEDLARRDFTMNAIAMSADGAMVDPYNGQKDIADKIIRAVGDPNDRFQEDALRLMRAVRFATTLGFEISGETYAALVKNAHFINNIAEERVRDELVKIIDSPRAHEGIDLMQKTGLLKQVLPELEAGVDVGQNKHHIYTVYEHNLYALKWAAEHNYPFHVKLASLLHDVGKPQTKRGDGIDSTFYGHEIVGAKIAKQALRRLKFPNETVDNVWMLVRYHLFYYNVGEVTERSVRRLLAKIGPENIDDLLKVRIADRKGSGVPKAVPYRLRHFQYMVEKVQKDPTSVKMLAVNGNDVMQELGLAPSPKVGQILAILLDEVLDDPEKNQHELLVKRLRELGASSDEDLAARRKQSEDKQKQFDEAVHEEIRGKYHVKE